MADSNISLVGFVPKGPKYVKQTHQKTNTIPMYGKNKTEANELYLRTLFLSFIYSFILSPFFAFVQYYLASD